MGSAHAKKAKRRARAVAQRNTVNASANAQTRLQTNTNAQTKNNTRDHANAASLKSATPISRAREFVAEWKADAAADTVADGDVTRANATSLRGADIARNSPIPRRTARALLTLLVVALSGMGLIGLGATATFNDTRSESETIATGTVTLSLGAANTSANRLNVAATDIAPGDTMQRSIDVVNAGTLDWASLTLTTAATTSSSLDTDTTNGLQMMVDECSQAWTEAQVNGAYVFTCGGTTTTRVASRAVIGNNISIGGAALTAGTTGHYRITLSLPSTADNSFQGLSSSIEYTFSSTQRSGVAK